MAGSQGEGQHRSYPIRSSAGGLSSRVGAMLAFALKP